MDHKNEIISSLDKDNFFRNLVTVKGKSSDGQELTALCPFHEDTHASFSVNINSGLWCCHGCKSQGDVFTFYQKIKNIDFKTAIAELAQQTGVKLPVEKKKISHDIVEKFHQALLCNNIELKRFMDKRGLTRETIMQYKIGWEVDTGRYTIPVYDEYGDAINIRRYKMGAKQNKMLSYVDEDGERYGEAKLFNLDVIKKNTTLAFLEGELDAILATQYSIKAFTCTSGAGTFLTSWIKYFEGKIVYICFDNDTAGKTGALRVAEILLKACKKVFIIDLPDTVGNKGDITNYFIDYGYKIEDFKELVKKAKPFGIIKIESEKAIDLTLGESSEAKYSGKKIGVNIMISGKDTAPYIIPGKFTAFCNGGEGKQCRSCPLQGGEMTKILSIKDPAVLELISVSKDQQMSVIRKLAGVGRCLKANIKIDQEINIEEVRLIPQITFSTEANEYVTRIAYYMEHGLKSNSNYRIEGYVWPEPKKEYATILFNLAIPAQDNIEMFKMTPEIHNTLKIFQPNGKISEKLDEIYADLEPNVTRIWGRQEFMLAVDLVFHSVLSFHFQNEFVPKGWLTVFVLGDSGVGKTKLVNSIISHYRLGIRVTGENATQAGLIGALSQNQGRWMLCVNENTLINSSIGILPIKEFKKYDTKRFLLENKDDYAYSTDYYCLDKKNTKIIQTKLGYEIEGTLNQPLLILSKEGNLEWKKIKNLDIGEYLVLKKKFVFFNRKSFKIKKFIHNKIADKYDKKLKIKLPLRMSNDLAEFLGLLIGNGDISYHKDSTHVAFYSPHQKIIDRFIELSSKLFNKKLKIYIKYKNHKKFKPLIELRLFSVNIRKLLIEFGLHYWLANQKEIPISILQGTYSEMQSFIKGYFSTDGNYYKPNRLLSDENVSITSASEKLINQLQIILLGMSILSVRRKFFLKSTNHWYWKLTIQGEYIEKFAKEINFIDKRLPIGKRNFKRISSDNIPYLSKLINKLWTKRKFIRKKDFFNYYNFDNNYLNCIRRGKRNINYKLLMKLLKKLKYLSYMEEYKKLMKMSNYLYLPIKYIKNSKSIVYDFYIPNGHNFIGNGFICHNSWGALPLNDRRLLVVDEFSGLNRDVVAQLSDLLSTGIASITKVVTEQTYARTRVIFMSNPREGRQLNTYPRGVDALKTLIHKNEDIRRLDFALTVASSEIPAEWINRQTINIPIVEHRYTSELCRDLVLWAWSRKPQHIKFEPEAESEIMKSTNEMAKIYHSQIPLVEPADQRFKIARMAVALAARLFSTDDDGENVIVKQNHVKFVVQYLNNLYKKQSMAYDQFSHWAREMTELTEESRPRLLMEYDVLPNAVELFDVLNSNDSFKERDIQTQMGYDKEELTSVMKYLSKNHLIRLFPRIGYVKTAKLNTLLRLIEESKK